MPTLREATPDDLAAIVDLRNRANPSEPPTDLDWARHREATRDPSLAHLRLVAEQDGAVIASGSAEAVWWFPPHLISVGVTVDPAWQRRRVGTAMLEGLLPFARAHGTEAFAFVSEHDVPGIAFARRHGFVEGYVLFESVLEVERFDPAPYAGLTDGLHAAGVMLTSLAETDTRAARRKAYELWKRLWQQIPSPDPYQVPAFESWERTILEGPGSNLEAFILAQSAAGWIGLSYMTTPDQRPAYNLFTGVDHAYRGKGIALAMKVETIAYARAHAIGRIVTNNNTTNPAMLAINERLGYQRLPGRIRFGRAP